MKKLFILATAFSIFSLAAVNAQSQEEQAQPAEEQVQPAEEQAQPQEQPQSQEDQGLTQDNRKEIQFSDLPEEAQANFEDSKFADWEVTKAYEVSTDEGKKKYELTVSDGTEEKTVTVDESGEVKEQK